MAVIEVPSDPAFGPRKEAQIDSRALDQAYAEHIHQQQAVAMAIFTLAAAIIVVAAFYAVRERRKIARAADAAIVSGLASSVRASRAVASKAGHLKARVLARANETTASKD